MRILALLALPCMASRCNDKADVPDPCLDKSPFKASIIVGESVRDTLIASSKILAPGTIYLKAIGDYDSVRWFLGGPQNTSRNKDYKLFFQDPEGVVDYTFIGYRKVDTKCFPNDKSSDTIRGSIEVVKRDQHADIVGNYLGYNESNPNDKFPITISFYDNVWGYFLKGIPKGCPGFTTGSEEEPHNVGLDIFAGNRGFAIKTGSRVCSMVEGKGYLKSQDSLIIEYTYYPMISSDPLAFDSKTKSEKFIGIRQP